MNSRDGREIPDVLRDALRQQGEAFTDKPTGTLQLETAEGAETFTVYPFGDLHLWLSKLGEQFYHKAGPSRRHMLERCLLLAATAAEQTAPPATPSEYSLGGMHEAGYIFGEPRQGVETAPRLHDLAAARAHTPGELLRAAPELGQKVAFMIGPRAVLLYQEHASASPSG